jgi:phosphoenolpyruvate carboxykinase (ATP)
MARMLFRLPEAAAVIDNPDSEELKELTARMPNARRTRYGNLNAQTEVVNRSKGSTFIVTDEPDGQNQAITREEGERWAERQDEYIADHEMIVIDGYIGNDAEFRTPARLYIEAANANIAGMQQQLYFEPAEGEELDPELTVIYTPNLKADGYPDDRLIAVDLEQGVTRVLNSDYFGESKKGGLRMWNKLVYDRGGIPLHAGCKIIPTERGKRVGLIVGLSGTGKTTTTFTRQNGSLPVQDDFVAWMPNGRVYATENGCFAKTFGLNPEDEPTIYGAVTQPRSYLENVSQHGDEVDFYDTNYTSNGRATFPFDVIEAASADEIEEAHFLLILNKNENIVPAVAKLEGPQAAAFFMLGETTGTSAGGADEAGKFLRVPGTNPFFPMPHDLQGNRFLELLAEHPLEVYLMNTGRVGGAEDDDRSRKVRIKHSSAIVKGVAEGTIEWERDPVFGYLVASSVPGIDEIEILQPRRLYEEQGRADEYLAMVERFKAERAEFLRGFPSLSDEIVEAVA